MKRSKFTELQIAFTLRQTETGTSVEDVCVKMGVSRATFSRLLKKPLSGQGRLARSGLKVPAARLNGCPCSGRSARVQALGSLARSFGIRVSL